MRVFLDTNILIDIVLNRKPRVDAALVLLELSNGSDMLGMVSGTGCMVSSVVGCYVGACGADVMSVAAAITAFNVASERAAGDSRGPGTFKPVLMDALHSLNGEDLDSSVRWRVL